MQIRGDFCVDQDRGRNKKSSCIWVQLLFIEGGAGISDSDTMPTR